ncbi:CMRF35-like molecule 7 [Lepisosteus oculatus]|uniref:CMRF35-like molecule 7 n=1 Tax=Lepisosteus oculatus TaxID=7918 RepID=UPI003712BAB3
MRPSVQIPSFLAVLSCVMSAERRVNGSEGGRVEIECYYPDGYQHKEKYWCRDPCWNKDVLIKTGKTDIEVTVGRFSLFVNTSVRTFTVTMNNLTLQDTAVYYCGLEQWGPDKYTKIIVSTDTRAPTVSMLSHSSPGTVTEDATATPPGVHNTQTGGREFTVDTHIVTGAVLSVIACGLLVAAVILFTQRRPKRSLAKDHLTRRTFTDAAQDAEYANVGTAAGIKPLSSVYYSGSYHQEEDSQGLYSLAQLPVDTPKDSEVYFLVTAH